MCASKVLCWDFMSIYQKRVQTYKKMIKNEIK